MVEKLANSRKAQWWISTGRLLCVVAVLCVSRIANADGLLGIIDDNDDERSLKQGRIVGGQSTAQGEYPWVVSLRGGDESWSWHSCGGSLISSRMVLTAAHCVGMFTIADIGRWKMDDDTGVTRIYLKPENIRGNPGYDHVNLQHDVALVNLGQDITDIAPMYLNHNPDIPNLNSLLTVIGWGRLKEGVAGAAPVQQFANLNYVDNTTCWEKFGRAYITNDMLCAYADGKDACQGDSGGPLITMDPNTGDFSQVGVVSFGVGCDRGYPGVYSRVSEAIDWINKNVCGDAASGIEAMNIDDCEDGKFLGYTASSSGSSSSSSGSSSGSGSGGSGSDLTGTKEANDCDRNANAGSCSNLETFTSLGTKKVARNCAW
eukprot:CAMPEP_0116837778 /NCGR_PEP_ID=MMETSP0418-20121206/8843_1 /TAXON_ID=1158023 /ORGANISM="Astrosyne radiata, Strain 13vi08-1A" /LENGTH=373 /DNA_ID=CAMNT_0004467701 /DNA_START=108 /DNA_END=1226 /DNA_ORIENTATION=-